MRESRVHIAGLDVQVGTLLRQRCAWCGEVLIDYDLARIAVPVGQDPRPSTWKVAVLVEVEDGTSWVREYIDGEPLPPNACAVLVPCHNAGEDGCVLHLIEDPDEVRGP